MLLSLGCAMSSQTVRLDDRSVKGHVEQAHQHRLKAKEHRDQYSPRARLESDSLELDQVRYTPEVYNPTQWHRHEADRELDLARQHEEAAGELARFEEDECRLFPPKTRGQCPLLGSVKSVESIKNGVRVELYDGISQDAVLAHSRCHIAFGMEKGREGMPGCPLYVKGVQGSKSADGHALEFTGETPETVKEIRSRFAGHVGGGYDDH